jgi:hypothetical protein
MWQPHNSRLCSILKIMLSPSAKMIGLVGAVADLEDRHSMALEGVFDFFDQHGLNQGQGPVRIVIQGDLKNPTDLFGFQLKYDEVQLQAPRARLRQPGTRRVAIQCSGR